MLRAVAREIRIADVVGEEEDDVRLLCSLSGGVRGSGGEEECGEEAEGFHGGEMGGVGAQVF